MLASLALLSASRRCVRLCRRGARWAPHIDQWVSGPAGMPGLIRRIRPGIHMNGLFEIFRKGRSFMRTGSNAARSLSPISAAKYLQREAATHRVSLRRHNPQVRHRRALVPHGRRRRSGGRLARSWFAEHTVILWVCLNHPGRHPKKFVFENSGGRIF